MVRITFLLLLALICKAAGALRCPGGNVSGYYGDRHVSLDCSLQATEGVITSMTWYDENGRELLSENVIDRYPAGDKTLGEQTIGYHHNFTFSSQEEAFQITGHVHFQFSEQCNLTEGPNYPVTDIKINPDPDSWQWLYIGDVITCSANGQPEPMYTWKGEIRGKEVMIDGNILTVTSGMTAAFATNFTCIAKNTVNGQVHQIQKWIRFYINDQDIRIHPSMSELEENDTMAIDCSIKTKSSVPPPLRIYWRDSLGNEHDLKGQYLTENPPNVDDKLSSTDLKKHHYVHFTAARREHSSEWFYCEIVNGSYTFSVFDLVKYGPSDMTLDPEPGEKTLYLNIGDEITCSATGEPDPKIFWMEEAAGCPKVQDDSILKVTSEMTGGLQTFTCHAENVIKGKVRIGRKTLTFYVTGPAPTTSPPDDVLVTEWPKPTAIQTYREGRIPFTVNPGRPFSFLTILALFAEKSVVSQLYTATMNASMIQPPYVGRFGVSQDKKHDLIIKSAYREDAGTYLFTMVNAAMESEQRQVKVTVVDRLSCFSHETIRDSERLIMLSCYTYYTGSMPPLMMWTNNENATLAGEYDDLIFPDTSPKRRRRRYTAYTSVDLSKPPFSCTMYFEDDGIRADHTETCTTD